MKFLIVALFISTSAFAGENISLQDVVTRVSAQNYKVYENALKVYQAKVSIEKARADLLPKLNLWSIAKIVIDPVSLVDEVPNVAPFLVPSNWFRLEQNKLIYLAEKEAYRALWGNELHAAKALFFQVQFDLQLLEYVRKNIGDLNRILLIARTREALGGVSGGISRDIEIRILNLTDDERALKVLVQQEFSSLSYAIGLKAEADLSLLPYSLPKLSALPRIDYKEHEFRVLANSPERRQFGHFLSVLSKIESEQDFAFLGGSTVSRGVAGGVFDGLPADNSLGFGRGPAMKIIEAQREILRTQQKGVEKILKRHLQSLSYSYNLDLDLYTSYLRRSALAKQSKDDLLMRIELGEKINVLDLVEASKNVIHAEASLHALQYRVINSLDRLDRLTFNNDYSMTPAMIESIQKR